MKLMKGIKKITTYKAKGDSGAFSAIVGLMLFFMLFCLFYTQQRDDSKVKENTYVQDGLSSSLLGASLISTDEYGLSNEVVMFDPLVVHKYELYYSVKPIRLKGDSNYHATYAVKKGENFYKLLGANTVAQRSFLSNTVNTDGFGPKQNLKIFKDLLKTNLNLNSNMVPNNNNPYMSPVRANGSQNIVHVSSFKIYNYYEYVVMGTNYETSGTRPLVNHSGAEVATCAPRADGTYDGKYNTWTDLKNAGLVHSVVVEYSLDEYGNIQSLIMHNPNDNNIIITNKNGETVRDENGNPRKVYATSLLAELTFDVNMGKSSLGSKNNFMTVSINKVSVVDTIND